MANLSRELGLFSVCALACGAMLSGLFVLPGHAAVIGGPAVYLAFLLAGLLFFPACLSKAEMATALPESGGDYVFIDRALGPLVSTMTGLGTWMALILKSAFALVGLSAYLLLMVPFSSAYALYVAAGIGMVLMLMNAVGVKKAGQLQAVLVVASLVVLLVFVERGGVRTDPAHYRPFLSQGYSGLIAATAFVIVSYAGVTKVASAAEEIRQPGRNIPLGMILSLGGMILLYTLVVVVYVGLVPVGEHGKNGPAAYENAPLARASLELFGLPGQWLMAGVAVLALASMANAGLLASSRYPMAMARYNQIPSGFARVHPRFSTPVFSILLTGGVMIFCIVFLPVVQLAKMASGFLLVVFAILNASVIIFRESDIEWYRPEFHAPLYPYLQLGGVVVNLLFVGFLGWEALMSVGVLTLVGGGWYWGYVRHRVDRESTLSRSPAPGELTEADLRSEEDVLGENHPDSLVLVPFFNLNMEEMTGVQKRLETTLDLFGSSHRVLVLDVREVSNRSFLGGLARPDDTSVRLRQHVDRIDPPSLYRRVHTAHAHPFVRQFAESQPVDWTVLPPEQPSGWEFLVSGSSWWLEDYPGPVLMLGEGSTKRPRSVRTVVSGYPTVDRYRLVSAVLERGNHLTGPVGVDFLLRGSVGGNSSVVDLWEAGLSGLADGADSLRIHSDVESLESALTEADDRHVVVFEEGILEQAGFENREEWACTSAEALYPEPSTPAAGPVRGGSIADELESGDVYPGTWKPLTKRGLYHEIARALATDQISAHEIEKGLWRTDSCYRTDRGNGVAVPHAVVPEGPLRTGLFSLRRPVQYAGSRGSIRLCLPAVAGPENLDRLFAWVQAAGERARNKRWVSGLIEREEPDRVMKFLRGGPGKSW